MHCEVKVTKEANDIFTSKPRSSHVCRSSGLDLFNARERLKKKNHAFILSTTVNIHLLLKNLVEVGDNLVEQPQALDPLVVGLELDVEFREVGNRGEDDAATVTLLVVQLLVSMEYNTWLRDESHSMSVVFAGMRQNVIPRPLQCSV